MAAIGDPAEVLPTALGDDARADRASILTMHVGARDEAYGLTELIHPAGNRSGSLVRTAPRGTKLRVVIKATDVTLSTAPPMGLSVRVR